MKKYWHVSILHLTFLVLLLVVSFHVVSLSKWYCAKKKKKKPSAIRFWRGVWLWHAVLYSVEFLPKERGAQPQCGLLVTRVAQKIPPELIWNLFQGEICSWREWPLSASSWLIKCRRDSKQKNPVLPFSPIAMTTTPVSPRKVLASLPLTRFL